MRYGSKLFAGVTLTAGGIAVISPVLHIAARDCDVRIELCPTSESAYLPDEPSPEHAPRLIFRTVAASVSTASVGGSSVPFTIGST